MPEQHNETNINPILCIRKLRLLGFRSSRINIASQDVHNLPARDPLIATP